MATNEGGESSMSVHVKQSESPSETLGPFQQMPLVEDTGLGKMKVSCKLNQPGEVFLSTTPKIVSCS